MENELNDLLGRVKDGDDIAFGILCEKYAALTESTVKRFAPSLGVINGVPQNEAAADCDELKQDSVMALYKAALTYDAEGAGKSVSFGLYAKICMNNAMISKVRKYKRTLRRLEKNAGMLHSERRKGRADRTWDGRDGIGRWQDSDNEALTEQMKRAVSALSDYERRVFDLYMAGKSTGEIASALDRSEKSVSNACYRVKAKIRGLLKQ